MERSLCAGRIPYPPGLRRHERPPYGAGETRRPPGKMQPPWLLQTHVGDDARIVPGCSRRRGVREGHAPPLHGIRARPAKWDCRSHPGERGAGCPHPAGPRGGGNVPGFEFQRCGGRERPPYGPGETRRPPGKMRFPQYTVGADSISARFAAARGSVGGINPTPTGKFFVSGKPGAAMFAPVCRGVMALPQGSAAGQAGPIWNRPLHGVFAAARGLREGHAPPLHAVRERPAKWDCRGHPGERRAGCPHPAAPRGGGNVPGFEFQRCGGRERPPYGTGETRRPPGKMQPPRPLQTHVGDDARIVPGCLWRRGGPREGHAPPLHGIQARPAKWACRGHPGERRAGCPHPAAPRGGAGFRGRDKSRPYEQILHLGAAKTPPSFLIPNS